MKFDRSSAGDWIRAAWLLALSLVASLVARAVGPTHPPLVVLSGHAFNGNLEWIARAWASSEAEDDWRYLAMSKTTTPRDCPIPVLRMWRPGDCLKLARSTVIVTDHGPGILSLLGRLRPTIAMVDVWHGVGFKALEPGYGDKMRRYRRVIAASAWDRRDQIEMSGLDPTVVRDLGYALSDPLIGAQTGAQGTRQVLIAPTWSHGRRTDGPGLTDDEVLERLAHWAESRSWHVVVRAHLNAPSPIGEQGAVVQRPMSEEPDTIAEIRSSAILVTDWSSIASDFHLTLRPVVYWDSPPPFDRFRLEPSDRVGPIVSDAEKLIDVLDKVADGSWFDQTFADGRTRLLDKCHGAGLDGSASARAVAEVRSLYSR